MQTRTERLDALMPMVELAEASAGRWAIEHFEVSGDEAVLYNIRCAMNDQHHRVVAAGTYTRLMRYGHASHEGVVLGGGNRGDRRVLGACVMSDTRAERLDHIEPAAECSRVVRLSNGDTDEPRILCVVNGLGLGMVTTALLARSYRVHVVVIEQSADVIKMVEPQLMQRLDYGSRLKIVHANAFAVRPRALLRGLGYGEQRVALAWHDVWDDISSDNLPEMHRLTHKWGNASDWQRSWARADCERQHALVSKIELERKQRDGS